MFDTLPALLPDLSSLYEDLHAHPELSFQEVRTAEEDLIFSLPSELRKDLKAAGKA